MKKTKANPITNPPQEVPTAVAPLNPPSNEEQMVIMQNHIKQVSAEVNAILMKNGLELVVLHNIRVNPELKQEEIFHEISLKPKLK